MKFKSLSTPGGSPGVVIEWGKELVVPNQALTLREILERFTRNQPVAVGRDVSYDEGEDDLEKVAAMDLVDKAEFVEKLKKTQRDFESQEKAKAKAIQDKAYAEAVKLAAKAVKKSAASAAKKAE